MSLPNATPIPFPARLVPWMVASAQITLADSCDVLGAAHFVETDSTRTAGGKEHSWAFEFPCGMRILIELGVAYDYAVIYSNPPDATAAIQYLAPLV
ncbi:MAG: hypothetical protein QF918_12800, partial [Pirellulaceae bacterium]|nr:hypothetical protein [Pirellulaceae bacterium]